MAGMKFDTDRFARVLASTYNLAKKKHPKLKEWTAFAKLWDDGDFSIELRHHEVTKVFYDYGIITTNKRDPRIKKRMLERQSKLLAKFLKEINHDLKKMK